MKLSFVSVVLCAAVMTSAICATAAVAGPIPADFPTYHDKFFFQNYNSTLTIRMQDYAHLLTPPGFVPQATITSVGPDAQCSRMSDVLTINGASFPASVCVRLGGGTNPCIDPDSSSSTTIVVYMTEASMAGLADGTQVLGVYQKTPTPVLVAQTTITLLPLPQITSVNGQNSSPYGNYIPTCSASEGDIVFSGSGFSTTLRSFRYVEVTDTSGVRIALWNGASAISSISRTEIRPLKGIYGNNKCKTGYIFNAWGQGSAYTRTGPVTKIAMDGNPTCLDQGSFVDQCFV